MSTIASFCVVGTYTGAPELTNCFVKRRDFSVIFGAILGGVLPHVGGTAMNCRSAQTSAYSSYNELSRASMARQTETLISRHISHEQDTNIWRDRSDSSYSAYPRQVKKSLISVAVAVPERHTKHGKQAHYYAVLLCCECRTILCQLPPVVSQEWRLPDGCRDTGPNYGRSAILVSVAILYGAQPHAQKRK